MIQQQLLNQLWGNLFMNNVKGYGVISINDGVTAQSLTAATPVKLTSFDTNGISHRTTPDQANDQITITDPGDYLILFHTSFTTSVNNVVMQYHLAINGLQQAFGTHRKVGTGADVGATSFVALLTLAASDIISILVEADLNTDLTVKDSQIVVLRVG